MRGSKFVILLAFQLLCANDYKSQVVVQEIAKDTVNVSSHPIQVPLGLEYHALRIILPPGAETGWHHHPFQGFAFVQKGHLRVLTRDGHFHDYGPGEAFAEVCPEEHNGQVIGKDTVELEAIFFSQPGQKFTIKD